MRIQPLLPLSCTAILLGACAAPASDPILTVPEPAPESPYPSVLVEGEPMYRVLDPDGIQAIDEPRFLSVDAAFDRMQPEETVLGVVGPDGTAKAYSAWQLDLHEIVNDGIDGVAIAVTWCPLASAGIVYLRETASGERTFGVSGKLWHGVLVMFDRQTETLWAQLDGRAIQGPDLGQRLEHYPSTFTTWEAWSNAHPDTLVLAKDGGSFEASRYADYFSDPERLFLPRLSEGLGDVLAPKEVIFGLRLGEDALAVPEALLVEQEVLNVEVGGVPIALVRDPGTGGVRALDRRDGGETIAFARGFQDGEARPIDAASGRRLAVGDFADVRIDRAYWYAWKRTHPASRVLR